MYYMTRIPGIHNILALRKHARGDKTFHIPVSVYTHILSAKIYSAKILSTMIYNAKIYHTRIGHHTPPPRRRFNYFNHKSDKTLHLVYSAIALYSARA